MNSQFLSRMRTYLNEEYEAFEACLDKPLYRGLSYNPKKIDAAKIENEVPVLGKSPFYRRGYRIDQALGLHPFHIQGAFYLQEPSASSAVQILDVQRDDIVLDLCSAPGGKACQIASSLKEGFLVCNEYDNKRVQILSSNLERWGFANVAITQGDVSKVCSDLESCFTKVLVDAPCSGEGMMKKHDAAMEQWSQQNNIYCASRQLEILESAYKALQKDGVLVYSTCTYAIEENEAVIASFLERHPDMIQVDPKVDFGRQGMRYPGLDETKVVRIYPMDGGEGHFICKMRKTSGTKRALPLVKEKPVTCPDLNLKQNPSHLQVQKDRLFGMEAPFVKFKRANCIRQGIELGQYKKNRFELSHALALSEYPFVQTVEVNLNQMDQFMHGQVLHLPCPKGMVVLCYQKIGFGLGKSDGSCIKNKIPKGIRLMEGVHIIGGMRNE